jgi:pimeloyl-ACP methyl ester carboxylesterase
MHQTPRSVDEFRDVVPRLAAAGLHAVAVDSPGFGASDPVPEPSIETFADVVRQTLVALGLATVTAVGHHTGGVIAVELAAAAPGFVEGLVLSSTPLVDEDFRSQPGHGVDDVAPSTDGSHLLALWRGRESFYPRDRPDLLERFLRDALVAGLERSRAGHALVRSYRMEERLGALSAPVLLVAAPEDPFGRPNVERMARVLPEAQVAEIPGGMVPLPDQYPTEYAELVSSFVNSLRR